MLRLCWNRQRSQSATYVTYLQWTFRPEGGEEGKERRWSAVGRSPYECLRCCFRRATKNRPKTKTRIRRKTKKQRHTIQLIKVRDLVGCRSIVPCSLWALLAAAVLGIAMIAMGEEIGAEMALRSFGHLVSEQGSSNDSHAYPSFSSATIRWTGD